MTDTQAVLVSRQTGAGASASLGMMVPTPRCPISVRPATVKDLPFMDHLQKMQGHMVGWMPTKQFEGKIALGQVVIAESDKTPVGYCISSDQYAGRDDVGIVYQLNVLPLKQRHLIGAALIKAVFERAAYGCRLFCCWCAQDIQANYFWEAIGFVPLAFRTGSALKQRIHIFWQRRVREDDTITPWWFPALTKSGAVREDRIVLPIPPGTHWRDAKPIVLPGMTEQPAQPALPPTRPPPSGKPFVAKVPVIPPPSKHLKQVPKGKVAVVTASGIRYMDRGDHVPEPEQVKPKKPSKPRAKNDPKMVKAARELRDRFLEEVNSGRFVLPDCGRYDVSRQIENKTADTRVSPIVPPKALPEAA
jgi:hypothetical protein